MQAPDPARDLAAVTAMADGDRAGLAALYDAHAPALLGLAMRIVQDRRIAEDLLHDVFLEAWRAARDFDPARGSVRTWLAVRMRSRCLDHQKSARVRRNAGDAPLAALVDPGSSPQAAQTTSVDRERVLAALAALGNEQRNVIELAYFEGLSCSEIADRIAIPIGTVKSRMAAAMSKLRAGLVPS